MSSPLVSSTGESFTMNDLGGKLVLVNFMFTSCGGICPMQTANLRQVMTTLDESELDNLVILSVSIDPGRDRPDVLEDYKRNYKIDSDAWIFSTGSEASIETLTSAFNTLPDDGNVLDHRGRYYLLDRRGQLLLSYNSGTTKNERLSRDLKNAVAQL
jgi:protein SCO1/2